MELNSKYKILKAREKINSSPQSTIMMTLNSNIDFNKAKLINMYDKWKKFDDDFKDIE